MSIGRMSWISAIGLAAAAAMQSVSAAPVDNFERPATLPGDADSATEIADEVIPDETTTEDAANLAQARSAFLAGDVDGCLRRLRIAVAQAPHLPAPHITLARMYMNAGQRDAARATLEKCAADDAQDPQLYVAFGELALGAGEYTDAAVHFEKALMLEIPENWTAVQRLQLRTKCCAGLAAVAERRGHWAAAADLLRRLVQLHSDSGKLRDRWAKALFLAGREDQAFEQYDIAHRQDKSINPPEVSMGVRNTRAGRFEQANKWYEKAVAKYPDNPVIHFEYSVALMCQDRTKPAEQHAAQAERLGIDAPALTLHRSQIAWQDKDHARAELLLSAALKKNPELTAARDLLALVLAESDEESQRREALTLAQANAEQHPDSPKLMATLGWVYYKLGQPDQAEPLLRTAAAQDGHPQTLYFAAVVLHHQGHPQEAASLAARLQQALSEPHVLPLRADARDWLRNFDPGGP